MKGIGIPIEKEKCLKSEKDIAKFDRSNPHEKYRKIKIGH